MSRNLTINPAPYKSSNLAIPPSPFSPQLPVAPVRTTAPRRSSSPKTKAAIELEPPPAEPLRWLWQCHICNRVYQLGITRRCLDDGHYFCVGTATVKRSRRTNKNVVRHKACASEFDYQRWKAWAVWRRSVVEQMEAAEALASSDEKDDVVLPLSVPGVPTEGQWLNGMWAKKSGTHAAAKDFWGNNCWKNCDYPSECRWEKQCGVQTPVTATVTVPSSPPPAPPVPKNDEKPKTTFDDILLDASIAEQSSAEHVDHPQETQSAPSEADFGKETEKKPSMDDLLESAKRRKRRSGGQSPSPLGSNPPSPTTAEAPESAQTSVPTGGYLQKAFDDFELDLKKSFERAGGLVSGWASSLRSTAALEEEKAELFVKGLRVNKKQQQQ